MTEDGSSPSHGKRGTDMGGYWTYHRTYRAGCCGGPGCCVVALLAIPVWPAICGFAAVKERIEPKKEARTVSEAVETETPEDVETNADDGAGR